MEIYVTFSILSIEIFHIHGTCLRNIKDCSEEGNLIHFKVCIMIQSQINKIPFIYGTWNKYNVNHKRDLNNLNCITCMYICKFVSLYMHEP